jgi:type II secretory pathway pseudopilin PulG
MKEKNQEGFSYIEVMCAIVILTVGILAQLSALSLSILRQREAEQQTTARQIGSSTLESIFAARDLGNANGIINWDSINTTDVNSAGLFLPGWCPIRQDSGKDGIQGTADDACAYNTNCAVTGYTNTSPLVDGFERQIIISNVQENSVTNPKKRRIEVKIRYYVGQLSRQETLSTIIADLPFYN